MRPVILIGNGCRYNPEFVEYLCGLGVPVLTTWMGIDLVPEDCPTYCGRPGIIGQRAANIIIQKCDSLHCYGARLDNETVGYNYGNFAKNARAIVFDCDIDELLKLPLRYGKVCVDLSTSLIKRDDILVDPDWLAWCKALYNRFPVVLPEYDDMNPYKFVRMISDLARPDDIIANATSGLAANVVLQTWQVKKGQRILGLGNFGPMGGDLPMAIGAAMGTGRRVICFSGDGGFQLNMQELELVSRYNLPIKFIVWNNGGYGSIRNTQMTKFGRTIGCDRESGLTLPSLGNIIDAYNIPLFASSGLAAHIDEPGPAVFMYQCPLDFERSPRVASRLVEGKMVVDDFEDMTPKLAPDELERIMDD